jgi:imidazolonepropionase-like amidohydrolase
MTTPSLSVLPTGANWFASNWRPSGGLGYTPIEALVAATKTGGEMVGFDVGTIEEGRLADLLLVDGDPTVDVSILQDRTRLLAIMQDGAFHRAPANSGPTGAPIRAAGRTTAGTATPL